MRLFSRRGGAIHARLSEFHLAVLGLVPRLLATVGEVGVDPAADRLTPEVYPDDPERSEEFRHLAAEMIDRGRDADQAAFAAGLEKVAGGAPLTSDEAASWMRAIGHARVILGARLGITADGWETTTDTDDSRIAVLHFLGHLQDDLVAVLTGEL